jgi:hypothetical protein
VNANGTAQVGTRYTVSHLATGPGWYHLDIPEGTLNNSAVSLVITPLGGSIAGLAGSTGSGGLHIDILLSGDIPWTFIAVAAD